MHASYYGGALRIYEPYGSIIITNCTFQYNSANAGNADTVGGAISVDKLIGKVNITTCTFRNNNAYAGGAIYTNSQIVISIN